MHLYLKAESWDSRKATLAELNVSILIFICFMTTVVLASRFFKPAHDTYWIKSIKGSGLEYVTYKE